MNTVQPINVQVSAGVKDLGNVQVITKPDKDTMTEIREILDSTAVSTALGKIKSGESIDIKYGDQSILTIKKDSRTLTQRIREFGAMATEEAANIVKQEPTMVFTQSALLAKAQMSQFIPSSISPIVDQGFPAVIRAVALVLDAKKLKDVWRSNRADKTDRIVTAGHIATDLIGAVGAGMMMIPSLAHVGCYMLAAGFIGDIGAFGHSIMRYFQNKGEPVPEQSVDKAG